jgi:hypothetical protein
MHALRPHLKMLEEHLAALSEDAMLLSELDGYLAGVLVCPDLIRVCHVGRFYLSRAPTRPTAGHAFSMA